RPPPPALRPPARPPAHARPKGCDRHGGSAPGPGGGAGGDREGGTGGQGDDTESRPRGCLLLRARLDRHLPLIGGGQAGIAAWKATAAALPTLSESTPGDIAMRARAVACWSAPVERPGP